MANNRIWLKCNMCGKQYLLAKSYGGGFYLPHTYSDAGLNQFFDDHAYCFQSETHMLSVEGDFSLEYETPPDEERRDIEERRREAKNHREQFEILQPIEEQDNG